VNTREAVELVDGAVPQAAGTWADLGAGEGTFTRALAALLPLPSRIYAVDRDTRALAELVRRAVPAGVTVIPVAADFTQPLELPGLDDGGLDGMLLGNALHFVPDAGAVLARLAQRLRRGGRVVLVEYDGRPADRWVPHPVPAARLPRLAAAAGLSRPAVSATRPSAYGGVVYVAAADRL
jgi:ubiquinone/menaquinone biosynthesis C-methylase UbiE